ncbi:hypothetical protein [Planctomonas psychrotolerans]|uniref:hypothetical protein n=1 Tax=Planctomonas psychrotolerans TaxID=2528712 RepID=UPI00123873D7|nr:hypothetical protein [Planctomonas psychrotolerans]
MNTITHPEKKKYTRITRAAVLGAAPVLALGLTGCNTAGAEDSADVEDVQELDEEEPVEEPTDEAVDADESGNGSEFEYDGVYDQAFYDDFDAVYLGGIVSVTAVVNDVVSPEAFTLAAADDTSVTELLVLHDGSATNVEPDADVRVTGTAEENFIITDAEESMGVDLDDDAFSEWEGMPYIDANTIDGSVDLDE